MLVIALGILLVLTIALGVVISLAGSGGRHSELTNAGQRADALAEAGVVNAVATLKENYPGTVQYPGDPALLPPRMSAIGSGSTCTPPVNKCVTWSGTLTGPLVGGAWRYEWRITSTATVRNPTGPGGAGISRTAKAIVPVVIPPEVPSGPNDPLHFLYAGNDLSFHNSVHIKAQVYATNDLHLESTAQIDGSAQKVAVGHDLYLKNPGNQIGLTGGSDPRIDEIHVVHECSAGPPTSLHPCGPTLADWDADRIHATVADGTIPPSFLSYTPQLTCCSPAGGVIAPSGSSPTNMGFWYQNANLGPYAPCTTSSGNVPVFDTVSGIPDSSINWSATPTSAINLTPSTSYSCKSEVGGTTLGELSWNASTQLLTVKGTIFIDGSISIHPPGSGGTARYTGIGTIVASGTFGMKNATICAKHPGYTGACDFSDSTPWDPNQSALVIIADGAAGGPGAQGDGSDFNPGESIEIKSAHFQGVLIANHTIRAGTTSEVQGPMISVYDSVWAGQSNNIIFPTFYFSPSGGGGVISDPPVPELLDPLEFSGG